MSNGVLIICYTYNHAAFIEKALQGFVMQVTDFPVTALVIDDCSGDGTAEIVEEYSLKYPGIISPVLLKENYQSAGRSKRPLIEPYLEDARYVAMCEGDDYWTDPRKLQKQFDAMEGCPEATICFHRVRRISREGVPTGKTMPRMRRFKKPCRITLDDLMREEFKLGRWTFQTSCFFIKSEMYKRKGELEESLFKDFPFGDLPLELTCLMSGDGIYIPEEMSCYRVFSGGYMSEQKRNPAIAFRNCEKRLRAEMTLRQYFAGRYSREISFRIMQTRIEMKMNGMRADYPHPERRPRFLLLYLSLQLRRLASHLL